MTKITMMDKRTNNKPFQRKELLIAGDAKKAYEEQLKRWVKGDSYHLIGKHDSCCPDFSCCNPELKVNKKTRETFYAAYKQKNDRVVRGMLMTFLSSFMRSINVNANIVSDDSHNIPNN